MVRSCSDDFPLVSLQNAIGLLEGGITIDQVFANEMNVNFAIAFLLAFALSRCETSSSMEDFDPEEGEKHYLQKTGNEISNGDILEEMLDYVIAEDDIFEGRKKKHKKKLLKFLAGALLFKAIFLPKIFALVKLLTTKAYLLSLLALIFAASVITSKKEEHNTEHVINLVPKGKGRALQGQEQAYRYWRRKSDESGRI